MGKAARNIELFAVNHQQKQVEFRNYIRRREQEQLPEARDARGGPWTDYRSRAQRR